MDKIDKNNGTPVKVVDITGELRDYVSLDEFMKRTAYIEEGIILQEEIEQNEWLTIDEAKDETIESIRQIYESDD
jgi:low affinity Fe/Cu permease